MHLTLTQGRCTALSGVCRVSNNLTYDKFYLYKIKSALAVTNTFCSLEGFWEISVCDETAFEKQPIKVIAYNQRIKALGCIKNTLEKRTLSVGVSTCTMKASQSIKERLQMEWMGAKRAFRNAFSRSRDHLHKNRLLTTALFSIATVSIREEKNRAKGFSRDKIFCNHDIVSSC